MDNKDAPQMTAQVEWTEKNLCQIFNSISLHIWNLIPQKPQMMMIKSIKFTYIGMSIKLPYINIMDDFMNDTLLKVFQEDSIELL